MEPAPRPEPFAWWIVAGVGLSAASVALLFFLGFDEPFALRGDNKLVHFPMKLDAWRQWCDGGLPQWSDGLWMGFGLLGDATTGVYYLPHALAFLVTPAPHLRAFDVATALHVGWLVAGTAVLLRRLGCRAPACAFGAAAVPLASHVLGWTAYLPGFSALSWWPWALVAGDRLTAARVRLRDLLLASAPIGLQVWAGYPETGLYSGVLVASWIVFARGDAPVAQRVLRVAALGVASALLAGPQLLPSAWAMQDTIRGSALDVRGLLTLQASAREVFDPTIRGLALAVLDPFVGGATLALATLAVVLRARRSAVLAGAALLAGLAALGDATPVYRVVSQLPVFELFRGPHKFFLVTQLSVLWLAALGLDAALARRASRRWLAGVAAVLAAACLAEHTVSFGSHLPRVTSGHTRMEVEVSEAMGVLDRVAAELEGVRDASGAPPRIHLGTWIRGLGSFPMVARLETTRGAGVALLPRSHAWLQTASLRGDQLRELGTGFTLRPGACPPRARADARIDAPDFCLREVPGALPRYALLDRVRRAASAEVMEAAMRAHGAVPEVLVLAPPEAPLPLPPNAGGPPGTVRATRRRPGHVELEVDARGNRVLLVRESRSPGWEARVDGAPVETWPAGGVFWAVPVPDGRHRVELSFSQPGVAAGWVLALAWALLWIPGRRAFPAQGAPSAEPAAGAPSSRGPARSSRR